MLIEALSDAITEGDNHTFINLYSYLVLRKQTKLSASMDNILVDGQLMVVVLRLLGLKKLSRKSFDMTSLAPVVFLDAIENGKTIYFVGSTQLQLMSSVKKITDNFPGLNVVRFRNGYFSGAEWKEEMALVSRLNPDIVVAGLGTPLQEQFLIDLRSSGWKGTGFTCGGFFHQTAAGINYYPVWMDKLNLRWLYRIYDEPKLAKRYFLQYPLALMLVVWDFKIKSRFTALKSKVS